MRSKLFTLISLFATVIFFIFVGCGGGGGGGDGSSSIRYTGNTAPAQVEDANAHELVAGALL